MANKVHWKFLNANSVQFFFSTRRAPHFGKHWFNGLWWILIQKVRDSNPDCWSVLIEKLLNQANAMIKKKQSCPATRHGGAWGERRYSSYQFLTSALDGSEWSASRPGRPLPPGKVPPVPIVQEAGWAPEPVWTQRLEGKSSASVGVRTPVVQSVVRHYTDWATPRTSKHTTTTSSCLFSSQSRLM
jgi:hypothetical protein